MSLLAFLLGMFGGRNFGRTVKRDYKKRLRRRQHRLTLQP